MTVLADYADKYPDLTIRREDGIIELAVHSEGWRMVNGVHAQLGPAFREIGEDSENRVMILTGVGDVWSRGFNMEGAPPPRTSVTPAMWDSSLRIGRSMLQNLMAIEIPIIGAVNGPAFIHAELLTMSDIVIASENAAFADKAHMTAGVVPGDGVQIWWPMLLGPNRGRRFLLTGEEIGAEEALRLGVVSEIVPQAQLNARAWEIARELAAKPPLALRYSRMALTRHIRQRVAEDYDLGMILEGMAVINRTT